MLQQIFDRYLSARSAEVFDGMVYAASHPSVELWYPFEWRVIDVESGKQTNGKGESVWS